MTCIPTTGNGQQYISSHANDRDGLMVWLAFLGDFNQDENIEYKVSQLTQQLQIPWEPRFEGGFTGYLDHIATIYNKLEAEDPHGIWSPPRTDKQKMITLRNAFQGTEHAKTAYDKYVECEKSENFDLYRRKLKDYWMYVERGYQKQAKRNARATMTSSGISEEDTIFAMNAINQGGTLTYLDNHRFKLLKEKYPDVLETLFLLRGKFKEIFGSDEQPRRNNQNNNNFRRNNTRDTRENRGNGENHVTWAPANNNTNSQADTNTQPTQGDRQTLPNQYAEPSRANNAAQDDDDYSSEEEIGTSQPSTAQISAMHTSIHNDRHDLVALMSAIANTHISEPDERNARMIRVEASTTEEQDVYCNTNVFVRANITIQEGWNYSTTDGGADTMVLGAGWTFISVYANRTVNIVGFNEHTARKSGCRVGTAATVMIDDNGKLFLAIAHEAVCNEGSKTSLLSEAQMRDHDLIVDSTSKHHTGVDGNPGTQCIQIPSHKITVPLLRKSALMICMNRCPTTEELDEVHGLPRIELTSKARWLPQEHYDEDDPIIIPLTNNDVLAQNVVHNDEDTGNKIKLCTPPSPEGNNDDHDDTCDDVIICRVEDIRKYIVDSIALFNEDITASHKTVAHHNLLIIDRNSPMLPIDKQERFKRIVSKMLYVSQRARPDIQDAIKFLHERTAPNTEQDWTKLKRVLRYLQGSLDEGWINAPPRDDDYGTTPPVDYIDHDRERSPYQRYSDDVNVRDEDPTYGIRAYSAFLTGQTLDDAPEHVLDFLDHDTRPTSYIEPEVDTSRYILKMSLANELIYDITEENDDVDRVDQFLQNLSAEELFGHYEPFDSANYAIESCMHQVHSNLMTSKASISDATKLQPFLGFRPVEVIRRTLECTTQLAMLSFGLPLKRHQKSLFPFLNRKRLHETVATDTFFSKVRDVSGAWCAQVFYGLSSHMLNVYGLRTESQGPQAYEDFARYEGIPTVVRSDNSKMQRWGKELQDKMRKWLVQMEYTEPHHPQQNPAESRAVAWLKQNIKVLRIHTGAPKTVWLWMAKYLADIHNVTADETLDWKTPWSKRKGETPDISAYLQFKFYEAVYYHDDELKFPDTKEKLG